MKKEQLESIERKELFYNGESAAIFRLTDGRLLKIAKPVVFESCFAVGVNYEEKISKTNARSIKEIVNPISIVYNNRQCVGYTMEEITGATFNEFDQAYTKSQLSDLNMYTELYKKIESVVKKANQAGIVMPDLCTCDNIIIQPNNEIKFIDFDGMQFGSKDKSINMSTSLGNPLYYINNPKYCSNEFHFSQELDKTSLTILMFLAIFRIDLKKIGEIDYRTKEKVTLKDVFQMLGIEDYEFMNKVATNLSPTKKGVYLGRDLERIAKNYEMIAYEIPFCFQTENTGQYLMKLHKK